jgi:hypothetical protein
MRVCLLQVCLLQAPIAGLSSAGLLKQVCLLQVFDNRAADAIRFCLVELLCLKSLKSKVSKSIHEKSI